MGIFLNIVAGSAGALAAFWIHHQYRPQVVMRVDPYGAVCLNNRTSTTIRPKSVEYCNRWGQCHGTLTDALLTWTRMTPMHPGDRRQWQREIEAGRVDDRSGLVTELKPGSCLPGAQCNGGCVTIYDKAGSDLPFILCREDITAHIITDNRVFVAPCIRK